MPEENITLDFFLASWTIDPLNVKEALLSYKKLLSAPEVSFDFRARPGISFSLRAKHAAQTARSLFVLIDVIDDEPENRWLSVCFYADMITDPKELGDFVPKGLLGEDACCFNLDADEPEMRAYVADRLTEALSRAQGINS